MRYWCFSKIFYISFCLFTLGKFSTSVYAESSKSGERTLIIAPHPDDETLGGAGVIQRAVSAGNSVKVVLITNGDGFRGAAKSHFGISHPTPVDYLHLGYVRRQESLQALSQLGVPQDDVVFLGYPDGGIHMLWEKNWSENRLFVGLNGSDHSPYDFSFEKRAPYCGENLAKNLSTIIEDYHPTDIVYPDPHDRHQDHWATNAFVKYVLAKDQYKGKEWTYLIHRGHFPFPWSYSPELPMNPPSILQDFDIKWHYYSNSKAEQARKFLAIQKYETQTRVMSNFLYSFIRSNDLLGTYSDPVLKRDGAKVYFSDPTADIKKSQFRGTLSGSDITKFGAFQSDKAIYFGVKIQDGIQSGVQYHFLLRLITSQGLKRLDANIKNLQIVNMFSDGERNTYLKEHSAVFTDQKLLWLVIPKNEFSVPRGIMLANQTSYKNERLDSTAWRYIRIRED